MTSLRLALPPLETLSSDSPLAFAGLDRQGKLTEQGRSSLAQLAQTHKGVAVECYLHPCDSLLASIELPNLPAARIQAAVGCAAQALILGGCESMHIVHGPRDAEGQVQVAWLQRALLERFGTLLRQSGFKLRGLYPAAFCLPVDATQAPVVVLRDEHLLIRHSQDQAQVHPAVDAALADLLNSGGVVHWVGAGAPDNALVQCLPEDRAWSGKAPSWGLHAAAGPMAANAGGWGRAVACTLLAVAVWAVGLNLYAARQVEQGQQLKAWMTQRVQQAFPALPMILNPLQQARQQLALRENGAPGDSGFTRLVQQAGNAMPFMVGSLQTLVFEHGELHLSPLPGTPGGGRDKAWQVSLTQAGVEATAVAEGWVLKTTGPQPQPLAENDSE
ncbi:type II secretion system protein GspL [Pseudomonas gingeri]|uniref:Type II secretion system protein GspL n=1 Tax=Pseudomonas gingeri TaxID=117681 RepID=A0A7Y7XAN7_9PSED|nr:type II secretion system protein GspL [Pseudomonas gingeri]NWB96292.1 type II secretion system protein GspL [Pseudomonas gingeri]